MHSIIAKGHTHIHTHTHLYLQPTNPHDPTSAHSKLNSQLAGGGGGADGGDLVVEQAGQEVGVVLAGDLCGEVLGGEGELVAGGRLGPQLLRLLLQQPQRVRLVHLLALRRRHPVLDPLPELRPRYFGRCCILPVFFFSFCSDKVYWQVTGSATNPEGRPRLV